MENSGLNEALLDKETIEATGLAIIGGVIGAAEENTLKRLLFRSTRGQAILHTFDINIGAEDVLLETDEYAPKALGYFVLFEDGALRRIVTKVCKSFMGQVYETSFRTVMQDLEQAKQQRGSVRQLIEQSKMNFVNYLTSGSPLKGDEDFSPIMVFKHFIAKERVLYKTLNQFKVAN